MKYFITSDIHGFYEELIKALNDKGYDKDNPNHTLVVLGDIFDRGDEPVEVYNFLMSIPESNLILVRGNHEDIFKDLLDKRFPSENDYANGTVETVIRIATYLNQDRVFSILKKYQDFDTRWNFMKGIVKESEIGKFMISSPRWHNYYEIDNYILVHGFIPTLLHTLYDPNWRKEKSKTKWEDARWDYAYEQVESGTFLEEEKKGKILVCGHVGANYVRQYFDDYSNSYDIYKKDNLIAIDALTVMSHQVNVLVIEK